MKENQASGYELREEKKAAFMKTGGRCAHCGKKFENIRECTLEHIIPRHKGGTNHEFNLTVLCEDCNLEKANYVINMDYFFPHILEEYQADYYKYFRSELDRLFPTDIIQEDIAYISAVNEADPRLEKAKKMAKRAKTRKTGEMLLKACTYTFKIEKAMPAEAEEISNFIKTIYDKNGVGMNSDYFNDEMLIKVLAEERGLYAVRGFGYDKELKMVMGYRPLSDMDIPDETQEAIEAVNEHTGLNFCYITQVLAAKNYVASLLPKIRDQIWRDLMKRGMCMFELCYADNWSYYDSLRDYPARIDGMDCFIRTPKLTEKNKRIDLWYEENENKKKDNSVA